MLCIISACTFATQAADCDGNIQYSTCNFVTGFCECPAVAGYVDDGTGNACAYSMYTLSVQLCLFICTLVCYHMYIYTDGFSSNLIVI